MVSNAAAHSLADESPALLQLAHQLGSPHHLPVLLVSIIVLIAALVAAGRLTRRNRQGRRDQHP
jgi:NADH:ubiquinone oxidoreductase subunit 6 (subunit J)